MKYKLIYLIPVAMIIALYYACISEIAEPKKLNNMVLQNWLNSPGLESSANKSNNTFRVVKQKNLFNNYQNIAIHKPVYAGPSVFPNTINVTDASTLTYSTVSYRESEESYIFVDLKELTQIHAVDMFFYRCEEGNVSVKDFDIYLSTDGGDWAKVLGFTENKEHRIFLKGNVKIRYFGLLLKDINEPLCGGYNISEIAILQQEGFHIY